MFSSLFGDGRIGGILAVIIGLCLVGLLAIYAWRAFGRGIRQTASRGARQPRLGIVDAFDLDRHRQLVLVRRDNVEHLIMIGGPNDLLIEGSIVRAQPAVVERREPPVSGPLPAERGAPRVPVEPPSPVPGPMPGAPVAAPAPAAPSLDLKPSLEPSPVEVKPPPLRPSLEPAVAEPLAPPPPLGRPATLGAGPRPLPPRPLTPGRPMTTPTAPPRPAPPPFGGPPRPAPGPSIAPPPPPQVAAPEVADRAPEPAPAREPPKEPARLAVNIDSLEEEMAKLLGRPIEPPKG